MPPVLLNPENVPLNPDNLPLRDIHLPPAISWWPPAPGWWLLLLGLVLLLAAIYLLRQYRQRRSSRRLALAQLEEVAQQYREQSDARQLLQALSRLLRQTTLLHFPQSACAGLVGDAWLAFLDQRLKENSFSQGVGRLLGDGPYLPQTAEFDAEALLSLCRRWLQQLPLAPKPQRRSR